MIVVYTLLGTKNFDTSRLCLRSFAENYRENFTLRCVSDGTLNNDQIKTLESLPHTQVVPTGELESLKIKEKLEPYPLLRDAYAKNPFFRKMVDIPLLAGERFAYIDSDIFFFGPFRGLFDETWQHPTKAQDIAVTPGIRDLIFAKEPSHANTNSGILQGPRPQLEDIEAYQRTVRDTHGFLREQSCWQTLWGRAPIQLVTRRDVRIAKRNETVPGNLKENLPIAFHLTGPRKHLVHDLIKLSLPKDSPVREVRKVLQGPQNHLKMLALKVWRRLIGWA